MNQCSDKLKCGSLFVPSVSFFKFKYKNQWIKRYMVLINQSECGIKRLEMFASEKAYLKKNNLIKIIPLNNCFKIIQKDQTYKENVFEIYTKETIYYFSADSRIEMKNWLHLLQKVAFGTNLKKETKEINFKENMFYSSIDTLYRFKVTIGYSEAAVRCSLYLQTSLDIKQNSKIFYLIFDSTSIRLISEHIKEQVFSWNFCNIRRYACTQETFSFEAGRKCITGPGLFLFYTKEGPIIFYLLAEKVKNCFIQNSFSSSSIVSSSNCFKNQIKNGESLYNQIKVAQFTNKPKGIPPLEFVNNNLKSDINNLNEILKENQKKMRKNFNIFFQKKLNEEDEYNDVAFIKNDYFNLIETCENYFCTSANKNIFPSSTKIQSSNLSILKTNQIQNNLDSIFFNTQSFNLNNRNKLNKNFNELSRFQNLVNKQSKNLKFQLRNCLDLVESSKKLNSSLEKLETLKSEESIFVSRKELFEQNHAKNKDEHYYELPNIINLEENLGSNCNEEKITAQNDKFLDKHVKFLKKKSNNVHNAIGKFKENVLNRSTNQLEKSSNICTINMNTFLHKLFQNNNQTSKQLFQLTKNENPLKSNNITIKQFLLNSMNEKIKKPKNLSLNINKLILNLDKINPEHYLHNNCEYAKIMKKTAIEHL